MKPQQEEQSMITFLSRSIILNAIIMAILIYCSHKYTDNQTVKENINYLANAVLCWAGLNTWIAIELAYDVFWTQRKKE